MKLFCFGMGYTASYFAKTLPWESIDGTHRGDFPLSERHLASLREATHILHSVPPTKDGDIVYKEFALNPSSFTNTQWFGYLSTTGVYGNHNGGWVDETTPTNPNNDRSSWRIEAEQQWLASGLPVNIFRLSGIYGAGRSAIDDLKNGTAKRIYKENQFFSRIHVEDIVQILSKSFNMKGEIFNCADDYPCSSAEVVEYAAKLMGIEPPPLVPFEQAQLSEMARSFYSSSRRVGNSKIKQRLGVKLAYPSYKEGLDIILTHSKPI